VYDYQSCDVISKKFGASFLTSSKGFTSGHRLRQEIYDKLPQNIGDLKIWKHRSPPRIDDKRTIIEPYQYHICPENTRENYYYSEKLIDAFMAKAIPVYYGCSGIGEHFNTDGMILFETCEEMLSKLSSLTPDYYSNRLPVVEENFKRASVGIRQWDLLEQHISEGLKKKVRSISDNLALLQLSSPKVVVNPRRPPRPLRRP
jgi:hypothetical protein